MVLSQGDDFPSHVVFSHVIPADEDKPITACGIPQNLNASEAWKDKKVVLVGMPGAFTPGCSERHLPGFIENIKQLEEKKVDVVAVVTGNDSFVQDAWRKANGIKNEIVFLSDTGLNFSKQIGWVSGDRPMRYAIVIDNGKVVYADVDDKGKVERSSAQTVLSKL